MIYNFIASRLVASILLANFCLSIGYANTELGEKAYLSVSLDVQNMVIDEDGEVRIPAKVTNIHDEDIKLSGTRGIVDLEATNDSGNRVLIKDLKLGHPEVFFSSSNRREVPFLLKPGKSVDVYAISKVDDISFVAGLNKPVFGVVFGYVGNDQHFQSSSEPLLIPPNLIPSGAGKIPWADLGTTSFFSVSPELEEAYVSGGNISGEPRVGDPDYAERIKKGYSENLLLPVKVTNLTSQRYIADETIILYSLIKSGLTIGRPKPDYTFKASGTNLPPSGTVEGTCFMPLKTLFESGYCVGDKIVVTVGGRIPNTNQVFACNSEPFELPPLPSARPKTDMETILETGVVPAVPAAPIGLNAISGDSRIAISWSAPQGATFYSIYRGINPGGEDGEPLKVFPETSFLGLNLKLGQ